MAQSTRGSSTLLVGLLVLEGLGGLLVTLLNVVTSRALGQEFLPWESAVIPAAFGVLCLIAAFGLWRSASWGVVLAGAVQALIAAAGVIALLDTVRPLAWVVLTVGLLGLFLVSKVMSGMRHSRAS